MYQTTAAELTTAGFVLKRGEGERLQYWHVQDAGGRNEGRLHDTITGRTFKVNDEGRDRAVLIASAAVMLDLIESSGLPAAVKIAQAKTIIDALKALK